jgi:site-specific DNA-methyltransferase (cytosine-N4-specific)
MDPFMGSGTTLIEARHLGFLSEGIELNPLAFVISRAKLDWEKEPDVDSIGSRDILESPPYKFDAASHHYLEKWFPSQTLCEILKILAYLKSFPEHERRIAEVILSNHLRDSSWQDPGDLRIRRRKTIPRQQSLIFAFVNDFNQGLESRRNWARGHHTDLKTSSVCHNGNSKNMSQLRGRGSIAGTVCSPPYATALPYVDTYRLSLVVLDLIKPGEINELEQTLIGARDIGRRDHELFDDRLGALPRECRDFINGLLRRADEDSNAGFRKRALPFALARYFFEMSRVFDELRHVEGTGSPNLWVIGTNRTRLLEHEIIIPTPQLLGHMAKAAGFNDVRFERLDAYGRYDIHSKNSIRSETLLSFYG